MLEIRSIPYIELDPHYNFEKKIKAKEIMSKPVVTLHEVEKLSTLLNILQETGHNGFPTINCEDEFFNGVILRNTLAIFNRQEELV